MATLGRGEATAGKLTAPDAGGAGEDGSRGESGSRGEGKNVKECFGHFFATCHDGWKPRIHGRQRGRIFGTAC